VPLSLEEKVRLLSMVDVFEALCEEELERLARLARDATYEQGEGLPEPQEGGEKLYVLKEGRVQLYVMLPNKGEITLSVVEGGSIFGEIAVAAQGSAKVRPGIGALFSVHPKDGGPRAADRKKPGCSLSHSAHAERSASSSGGTLCGASP